jgi:hypothetical protein
MARRWDRENAGKNEVPACGVAENEWRGSLDSRRIDYEEKVTMDEREGKNE